VSASLVLYEGSGWRTLRPLSDALPVPGLAFGAGTLASRWHRSSRLPLLAIAGRPLAIGAWRDAPRPDAGAVELGEVVAVDATALPGPWFDRVRDDSTAALYRVAGAVIAARVSARVLGPALGGAVPLDEFLATLALPTREVEAERIVYPWDLIARNASAIAADLDALPASREGDVHPQAALLAPERIAILAGARIDPFACLDAREGPIAIGRGARVLAGTVVSGPCAVGAGTQLLGGFIGRSSLGPECRIAGEVEECVWQGYGNKRHHGFVGHSVFGEWVNLGALTTTSDLKNNYGSVRVRVDGREIDSGSPKVGSIVGAHVKTGIGTLLPTGAAIGVGSNLFAGGRFAPKDLPSFSWWDGERFEEHRLASFLETAKVAMSRRNRRLEPADETQLRQLFLETASERERFRPPLPSAADRPAAAR